MPHFLGILMSRAICIFPSFRFPFHYIAFNSNRIIYWLPIVLSYSFTQSPFQRRHLNSRGLYSSGDKDMMSRFHSQAQNCKRNDVIYFHIFSFAFRNDVRKKKPKNAAQLLRRIFKQYSSSNLYRQFIGGNKLIKIWCSDDACNRKEFFKC